MSDACKTHAGEVQGAAGEMSKLPTLQEAEEYAAQVEDSEVRGHAYPRSDGIETPIIRSWDRAVTADQSKLIYKCERQWFKR